MYNSQEEYDADMGAQAEAEAEAQYEEEKEAELYFIQFLFCENRQLLLSEFRKLYDELLKKWIIVYFDGRKKVIELSDIIRKFKSSI